MRSLKPRSCENRGSLFSFRAGLFSAEAVDAPVFFLYSVDTDFF